MSKDTSPQGKPSKEIENIRIVGLPKGAILWPTAFFALIAGVIGVFVPSTLNIVSGLFLIIFTFNLLILFFDFGRGSLFGIAGFGIAVVVLIMNYDLGILEGVREFLESGVFGISAEFLMMYGLIFLILFFIAYVVRRNFDYFVISSNEMVQKSGILGDAKRFDGSNIQIEKSIPDVFESLLLFGAGELIITTGSGKVFHINNVPRINYVEDQIRSILSSIEVDTS